MSDVQAILVYADIQAAHDWLVDTFELKPGGLHRDEAGQAMHGEVRAGDTPLWLHRVTREHGLDAVPALGAASGMLVIYVPDVDGHFDRVRARGARIRRSPQDMPYGQREYAVDDCEGRIWCFATRT